MKKFALLGAVAALATAGGVFAAWTYSEGDLDNKISASGITVDVAVDEGSSTGAAGTLTVSGSIKLIAKNVSDTDYAVKLENHEDSEGLTITYTHKAETDRTLTLSYSLEIADTSIGNVTFGTSFSTAAQTVFTETAYTNITVDEVIAGITISDDKLSTLAQYNTFKNELSGLKPVLKITVESYEK